MVTATQRKKYQELGIYAPIPTVLVEIGHWFTKFGIVTNKAVIRHFRSLCAPISQYDYERYMDTDGGKDIVGDKTQWFIIGDAAQTHTLIETPIGQERYTGMFYLPIFVYALAQLYPDGLPAVMNAYVTYPYSDYYWVGELKDLLIGKHRFESAGKQYETEIISVTAQPESLGSLAFAGLDMNGKPYEDSIFNGKHSSNELYADTGGGTFQLSMVHGDGGINKSFPQETHYGLGGQGILDALQKQLRESPKHRQFFRHITGAFPIALLNDILLSPNWVYQERGFEIDCADVVHAASAQIINAMYSHIKNHNNLRFNRLLVSGGGGLAIFQPLKRVLHASKVLKDVNTQVVMLASPRDMIVANALGHIKVINGKWREKGVDRDALEA